MNFEISKFVLHICKIENLLKEKCVQIIKGTYMNILTPNFLFDNIFNNIFNNK